MTKMLEATMTAAERMMTAAKRPIEAVIGAVIGDIMDAHAPILKVESAIVTTGVTVIATVIPTRTGQNR